MSVSQPTESTAAALAPPPPWHAAYPAPRKPEQQGATREEVLAMLESQLKDQNRSGPRDFVLVDLRRTDHEV
jgi:arsenical-resistance protein 2